MKTKTNYSYFGVAFLLLIFFATNTWAQMLSPAKAKARWIFNFAKYVTWPAEHELDKFTIVLYGGRDVAAELEAIAKTESIKNLPVQITLIRKLSEINTQHIVYVDQQNNPDVSRIYELIINKPVLLITDNFGDKDKTMINFLSLTEAKKFEINKENCKRHNLFISERLLLYGGTEGDLRKIFTDADKRLDTLSERVAIQEAEIKKRQVEIEKQKEEIEKQKQDITEQKNQIVNQRQEIDKQRSELSELISEVKTQKAQYEEQTAVLSAQTREISTRERKLKAQQDEIAKTDEILLERKDEMEMLQKQVEEKEMVLTEQGYTIQKQQNVIYVFFAFFFLILGLIYFIYRSYQIKRKANIELELKNAAINQQKEEILAQAEELAVTNDELRKLSIVASETDNAVLITDIEGNFEWVNAGFTRIFELSLEDLIRKSRNIMGPNTSPEIITLIKKCINEKVPVSYEFQTRTKDNRRIWVHATLTPIVDEHGNLLNIIVIDSDITRMKQAENEIMLQKTQVEKAYSEIMLLSSFGQRLTSTLNVESIHQMSYEYISKLLSVSGFGIGTYNERKNTIAFRYYFIDGRKITGYERQMERQNSLTVWCYNNKKEVIVNDLQSEYSEYVQEFPNDFTHLSLIYIPLIIENNVIGVLTVQHTEKNIYKESDVTNLRALASYIAIALDNARAYDIVDRQNENIKGSIRYAKTIQWAILPLQVNINKAFENFIIYRPKDIVSGDFYWFTPVTHSHELGERTSYFAAVVDCTGHGVPGAFMSMVGNRLLNEIVIEKRIFDPGEILINLNLGIRKALKQDQTDNDDGMDVCLCHIEPNYELEGDASNTKTKVTFAGARRPLFFCKQSDKDVKFIRGSINTVGGKYFKSSVAYQNHELFFDGNDQIWLTSDGFTDQQNRLRHKFGTRGLIASLSKTTDLSCDKQSDFLQKELDAHKNKEDQRDDITVWGIKL